VKNGTGPIFGHNHDARGSRPRQGIVDWASVFAAAQGKVQQYVIEQDPPVEPFSFAAESFEYVDCLVF
jgi:hypothetical protein